MFRLFFWLGDMPVYPAAVASAELLSPWQSRYFSAFLFHTVQWTGAETHKCSHSPPPFSLANIKYITMQIHVFPCDVIFTTVQTGALQLV